MRYGRITEEEFDAMNTRVRGGVHAERSRLAELRPSAPSPTSQKFFIGCRLPGMNEILTAKGKPGWSKDNYTNLKLLYESMIRVDIKQAKLTPMTMPAFINFVWVEPNAKRDFDNIRAGAKFILDALVAQKILQDDTRQYVLGFTDTFRVEKTNPGVWVSLDEVNP